MYGERYPFRRQPNHQKLARVRQNLAEHASFRDTIEGTGRPGSARTSIFEELSEIMVPVYGHFPLQPKDLEQLSIGFCRANSYTRFMHRECSYDSQMITHDSSHLYCGLLTKVQQTCTLPGSCCTVMKPPLHVEGFLMLTTCTLNNPYSIRTTSRTKTLHLLYVSEYCG